MSAAVIQTKQFVAAVNGVRTEFLAQGFGDYILLLVTQLGKVGTLIRASKDMGEQQAGNAGGFDGECDDEEGGQGRRNGTYSLTVLLGKREDEILLVYARGIAERIYTAQSDGANALGPPRPVLIGLALKDQSMETYREVTSHLDSVRVW